MLESDEKTQLADFLIETSYAYSLNITSVEARQIAEALIDNDYRPVSTVRVELLKEVRGAIKDRARKKELRREYMTDYSNGYIEGMIEAMMIIDTMLGKDAEDEEDGM